MCFAASRRHDVSLRHEFVIGPLCESDLCPGKKARLYYCIRCKWNFLVCGSKVAVLDEHGNPLLGDESLRRFDTFEGGPCPVLEEFASGALLLPRKSEKHDDFATKNVSTRFGPLRPLLRIIDCVREDSGR
jgi:hypothetical protein